MKHIFLTTPSGLTHYCECGRFWLEAEGDKPSPEFERQAKAAFDRHVALAPEGGELDTERLDWMEEMRRECEGHVLARCLMPGEQTLRENIDKMRRPSA